MPDPITATVVGVGSAASGAIASRGARKAAAAQQEAIATAQGQLAESNIRAAELIAGGQHEAAAAIMAAGEKAAAATLSAAKLAREQIQKFFEIAQADISEKLAMSRDDIQKGLVNARDVLNPYNESGIKSFQKMTQMLGVEGAYDYSELENSPQYQFAYDQNMKAIDRGSRMKLTGGQLKALQERGNALASTEFDNRVKQLLAASQIGLQAAGGLSDAELRAAGMKSSANMGAAGALATTAGNAGNQNAQIAQTTGSNLANIALGTGNALANNATSTANALAQLESMFGQNTANLTMGAGAAEANGLANSANAWSNAINQGTMLGTYAMHNPLMTGTTTGSGTGFTQSNYHTTLTPWAR